MKVPQLLLLSDDGIKMHSSDRDRARKHSKCRATWKGHYNTV